MNNFLNFNLKNYTKFYFINAYKKIFVFNFILFLEIDYKNRFKVILQILRFNLKFFFLNSELLKDKYFDGFLKFLRRKNFVVIFTSDLASLKNFLNFLKENNLGDSSIFCFNRFFLNLDLSGCLNLIEKQTSLEVELLHLLNNSICSTLNILHFSIFSIILHIQNCLYLISLNLKQCSI